MSKYTFTDSNYDSICKQASYGCLWGYEIDNSIYFSTKSVRLLAYVHFLLYFEGTDLIRKLIRPPRKYVRKMLKILLVRTDLQQ